AVRLVQRVVVDVESRTLGDVTQVPVVDGVAVTAGIRGDPTVADVQVVFHFDVYAVADDGGRVGVEDLFAVFGIEDAHPDAEGAFRVVRVLACQRGAAVADADFFLPGAFRSSVTEVPLEEH